MNKQRVVRQHMCTYLPFIQHVKARLHTHTRTHTRLCCCTGVLPLPADEQEALRRALVDEPKDARQNGHQG